MFKWWPPKGRDPAPLSVFQGVAFQRPKGTNNGESATDAASLVWAHKEQLHQDLGPWRMLPWRERGPKPLNGRAAEDHVGCCVFCVLRCGHALLLGVLCMNTHKKGQLCQKK